MDFERVERPGNYTEEMFHNVRDFGTYKIEVMKFHQGYEDKYRNGPWCWCAYVHIKPQHKFFKQLSFVKDSSDQLLNIFSFHGGCTYFGVTESGDLKIGCDFQHYGDDDCGLPDIEDMPTVAGGVKRLEDFMNNINIVLTNDD